MAENGLRRDNRNDPVARAVASHPGVAAAIESDALSMRKEVYQQVDNTGAVVTFGKVLEGRKKLVDSLAPAGVWNALLNTTDSVKDGFVRLQPGLLGNPQSAAFYSAEDPDRLLGGGIIRSTVPADRREDAAV